MGWERYMAIIVDGLRAPGAHRLPDQGPGGDDRSLKVAVAASGDQSVPARPGAGNLARP